MAEKEIGLLDDATKQYLYRISEYPILSKEEQLELLKKYSNGDSSAKEKLINSNLRLVIHEAKKYKNKLKRLDFLDLIQEGTLGLSTAIDKFDFSKNTVLSTYAVFWIDQAIGRYIMNEDSSIRLPVYIHGYFSKYVKFIEKFYNENNCYPSDKVVQEHLEISKDTLEILKNISIYDADSIDRTIGDQEDSFLSDFIADPNENSYSALSEESNRKSLLYALSKTINGLEYWFIYHTFFTDEKMSLDSTARLLGCSKQRIGQIKKEALSKIKSILSEDGELKNTSNVNLHELKHFKEEPLSVDQRIILLSVREVLGDLEYYVFYRLFLDNTKQNLIMTSKKLYCSKEDLLRFYQEILEKIKPSLKFYYQNKEEARKNIINKYRIRPFFDIDLKPNYKLYNYEVIMKEVNQYDFYEILQMIGIENYENLTPTERYLIQSYYDNKVSLKQEDLIRAEIEINNKILNYFPKDIHLPLNDLYETLMNTDKFSNRNKALLDVVLFNNLSLEEVNQKLDNNHIKNKKNLVGLRRTTISRLEKLYFGLDHVIKFSPTCEIVKDVIRDKGNLFSDEEINLLKMRYGLEQSNQEKKMTELATILNVNKDQLGLKLGILNKKILLLYYDLEDSEIDKDEKKYGKYITNFIYDFTMETRNLLKMNILDKLDYDEISKKTGLKRNKISNLIQDGIRKMDCYRFGIIQPTIKDEESLEAFYRKNGDFDDVKKQIVKQKFFLGKQNDEIARNLNVDIKFVINTNRSFQNRYKKFITQVDLFEEDYRNELEKHLTDSVLNEQERKFLSDYKGYNFEKRNLSVNELKIKYDLNDSQYAHLVYQCNLKLRLRKQKILLPEWGIISRKEMIEILKDGHVPLSDKEKQFLRELKGIGQEALTIDEIRQKHPEYPEKLKRFYQRAILNIKRYQNGEIKKIISYEEDIVPIKPYFTKFENKVLKLVYQDKIPITQLYKKFHVTQYVMLNHVDQIKIKLASICRGDGFITRFNFDEARDIIKQKDLPFEGNRNTLLKVYEMAFGEDGNVPRSLVEIAKEFSVSPADYNLNLAKYEFLIAVCKYKLGYRKQNTFTYDDAKKVYMGNKDKYPKQELRQFEPLVKKNFTSSSLQSNQIRSNRLNYLILKAKNELAFTFENTSQEEIKRLLHCKDLSFSNRSKKVLCRYAGFNYRDLMSVKEKRKLYRLLEPYFVKVNKTDNLSERKKL